MVRRRWMQRMRPCMAICPFWLASQTHMTHKPWRSVSFAQCVCDLPDNVVLLTFWTTPAPINPHPSVWKNCESQVLTCELLAIEASSGIISCMSTVSPRTGCKSWNLKRKEMKWQQWIRVELSEPKKVRNEEILMNRLSYQDLSYSWCRDRQLPRSQHNWTHL